MPVRVIPVIEAPWFKECGDAGLYSGGPSFEHCIPRDALPGDGRTDLRRYSVLSLLELSKLTDNQPLAGGL